MIFFNLTYGQEVSLDTSRKKERGTLFHEYLYICYVVLKKPANINFNSYFINIFFVLLTAI